jgi:hypothetical protein
MVHGVVDWSTIFSPQDVFMFHLAILIFGSRAHLLTSCRRPRAKRQAHQQCGKSPKQNPNHVTA